MNCHKNHDCLATCGVLNVEELEKKANRTFEFPQLALLTGNSIAVFTMLVLQEMLEQQAVNPIANFTKIIQLSNSIATLNSSLKTIQ